MVFLAQAQVTLILQNSISQHVKVDLNKKLDPKQKIIQTFNIDAQGFRKTKNEKSSDMGNKTYQLTSTASLPMVGRLAGTGWLATPISCVRGFSMKNLFCSSEPMGINIECLNSLLLGIQLFI